VKLVQLVLIQQLLVHKVIKEFKVKLVRKVQPVIKEFKESKVKLVRKVQPVIKEFKESKVKLVRKVQLVPTVLTASMALTVPTELV
jgi:hypothetical protein